MDNIQQQIDELRERYEELGKQVESVLGSIRFLLDMQFAQWRKEKEQAEGKLGKSSEMPEGWPKRP